MRLPCQALDHVAGYLLALGTMTALARRAVEDGSWLVRLSLAQAGRWIDGLGRVDGLHTPDPTTADVADLLARTDSPFGRLRYVAPVVRISGTPGGRTRLPAKLGTHEPAWL